MNEIYSLLGIEPDQALSLAFVLGVCMCLIAIATIPSRKKTPKNERED